MSHWRNFEVRGPERHDPTPVHSYFMVLSYNNLAIYGSVHAGGLAPLGLQKFLAGFLLPFSSPCKFHPFLLKIQSCVQPCRLPDFPAHETYCHKWVSLGWYSSQAWLCVYLCILGYMFMRMDTSPKKAITFFHVQTGFPISWQKTKKALGYIFLLLFKEVNSKALQITLTS